MELATIHVSGVNAKVVQKAPVPVNIIGGYVDVIFDDDWDGLVRTAVIHGATNRDVVNVGNRFEIPQETVSESGIRLKVGFYGVSQDGGRGIPTLWADLGVIQEAADPSGDESTDPALPVWAQLQALIGDLDNLNTEAKETIVAAINEALTKGGADPAEVARLVEEYLEQNPITADQIGAVGKEELPNAINEALAQAKASGEFDGKDYVLTDADKSEIAEMAAELVDVPEGSGGGGTLLPETELSQQGLAKGFDINTVPVGEKVAVIMDGKPYITTHRKEGEGADALHWIGNIAMLEPEGAGTEYDTGEPFFAQLFVGHSTFFFADGASHKVAICTVDALDEVYVNALNSIGNMSGGSGSFVVNVVIDGELQPTSADKTYEEINGALESGMSVVAVADDVNIPYVGLNVDNGSILFAFNGGTYGGAELILILSVTPENVWSMTVKDFITAENIGMKYVSSNTFNAFTKGVAKVQTASVGQTIKVKSVDDNGVPTAWEAVDFPSGGNSGGNVDLHIGPDKPTNGALYWLDTSEDTPVVPDVPDEPDNPEIVTYTITNTLTNVTNSNSATSVEENASYKATLTAADGYEISTVKVTMGGTDVTSTVYAGGVVNISAVTGNVVITATATAASTESNIYKLADIAVETTEGLDASGQNKTGYTRYKIEGVKTGDIVRLAGTQGSNEHGWYDGTTAYRLNDTSWFTGASQDNYAWRQYTWVADADYDYLYFASMHTKLETNPNSAATIEKVVN